MRQTRRLQAASLLVLCCFLAGCSAWTWGREIGFVGPLPEGSELFRSLEAQKVTSLTGSARIRLRNLKQLQKTVEFDADIACSSRCGFCRLEGVDLWGHVFFLAILRQGILTTYWAAEQAYSEDPADAEHLGRIMGLSVSGPELIELILGNPFFKGLGGTDLEVSRDAEGLVAKAGAAESPFRYKVWLDPSLRPLRTRLEGAAPLSGMVVAYDRYRLIGDQSFPGRIRVFDGNSREILCLTYENVSLDEPLDPELFEFTPPEGTERVSW
jgi:hypothetical protein